MKNKTQTLAAIGLSFFAIVLSVSVILCVLFIPAKAQQTAEQTYPLKIWMQNKNGPYATLYVDDTETGVQYIVVVAHKSYDQNGYENRSIAITPRLNADGTLYTGRSGR